MPYVPNGDFLSERDARATELPNSQMTRRGRLNSFGQVDRKLLDAMWEGCVRRIHLRAPSEKRVCNSRSTPIGLTATALPHSI